MKKILTLMSLMSVAMMSHAAFADWILCEGGQGQDAVMVRFDTCGQTADVMNQLFPTVVKIDAESAELQVLQGLEMTLLGEIKPVITLEVGDLQVSEAKLSRDVITWLLDRDYKAFEFVGNQLVPHVLRPQYEYDNLIFLPNSRISTLKERISIQEA